VVLVRRPWPRRQKRASRHHEDGQLDQERERGARRGKKRQEDKPRTAKDRVGREWDEVTRSEWNKVKSGPRDRPSPMRCDDATKVAQYITWRAQLTRRSPSRLRLSLTTIPLRSPAQPCRRAASSPSDARLPFSTARSPFLRLGTQALRSPLP
jgi:hypothetical protein